MIPRDLLNPHRVVIPIIDRHCKIYCAVYRQCADDALADLHTTECTLYLTLERTARQVIAALAMPDSQAPAVSWLIAQYLARLCEQRGALDAAREHLLQGIEVGLTEPGVRTCNILMDRLYVDLDSTLWDLGHEILYLARGSLALDTADAQASLEHVRDARRQIAASGRSVLGPDGPQWPARFNINKASA